MSGTIECTLAESVDTSNRNSDFAIAFAAMVAVRCYACQYPESWQRSLRDLRESNSRRPGHHLTVG